MFVRRHALALSLLAPLALLAACSGGGDSGSGGNSSTSSSSSSGSTASGGGGSGGSPPVALHHRVGRFDESDPARPNSSWSGTTFRTRVSGSSLSVSLGGAGDVIFQIEIDGQPAGKLTTMWGDYSYEVATGLSEGEHDVVLVRRNEGFFGDVAMLGFEPGPGATLVPTPWPYAHRIELIGDSLTAGYGIEGDSATCGFSGATESFYGTYGAIAARNVGAAVHAIAYSGKGVFQNYSGDKSEPMAELWRRTLTNDAASTWDFSRFTPDVVVVNLGSNDFSSSVAESDFVGAYVALLDEVRTRYPSALIFCVTWKDWGETHSGWVTEAMAMTGDTKLRHLGFSVDPADGLGCEYHTNLITNQKLGAVLTEALRAELGW